MTLLVWPCSSCGRCQWPLCVFRRGLWRISGSWDHWQRHLEWVLMCRHRIWSRESQFSWSQQTCSLWNCNLWKSRYSEHEIWRWNINTNSVDFWEKLQGFLWKILSSWRWRHFQVKDCVWSIFLVMVISPVKNETETVGKGKIHPIQTSQTLF